MAELPGALIPLFLRATGANRAYLSAARAEERVRERALQPQAFGPPRGLRRDIRLTAPRRHGRPVYRFAPLDGASAGSIVYAHGGGWVSEVARQHWELCAQLSAEAHTTVDLVIYPLVPFGTADEVVQMVAELVRENREELGATSIAGDSAGGQIALSAALLLRDHHALTLPLTALISPALDLTFTNPRIPEVQPRDPWLGVPGGRVFADYWRGSLDILDPIVSPLAGELAGLGPLTVFTGTRDILNPDAELLHRKAAAAGVPITFHEVEGQLHVYPLLPTRVGRDARAQLVQELRAAVSS